MFSRPARLFALASLHLLTSLLASLLVGGCAGANPCRGKNEARCVFEAAERGRQATPGDPKQDPIYTPGDPLAPTRPNQWDRATEILGEAWTMMGEGVGRLAVAEVTQESCADGPSEPITDAKSWTCQLSEPPVLAGRDFVLEVGSDGVIALTAFNLGEGEATQLLDDARRRWRSLCSEDFAPYTPPRANGDFRGCVLNDGPLLVLSRFLPDPTAPLWQVSLAVMPAG